MKLLICDDDISTVGVLEHQIPWPSLGISRILQAYNGEAAIQIAVTEKPELIICDIGMPRKNGLDVLKYIRQQGLDSEFCLLTCYDDFACATEAIRYGVSAYLTKPFEPKELLACVRMLTRRQPEQRASNDLEYGDLHLETDTLQLSCGERSVRLSRKEFDLMELLMRSRDMVLTKEQLILKVWGYESDAEDNNVEVYISFLRKKLEHLHSGVKIRTIRMVGYCLTQV